MSKTKKPKNIRKKMKDGFRTIRRRRSNKAKERIYQRKKLVEDYLLKY